MKRKQITDLIPKVGTVVIVSIFFILVIVGMYRDNLSEICNGFMGTEASCIEETAVWPFGLIAFPLVLLLGAWWIINFMSKSVEASKPKSKRKF